MKPNKDDPSRKNEDRGVFYSFFWLQFLEWLSIVAIGVSAGFGIHTMTAKQRLLNSIQHNIHNRQDKIIFDVESTLERVKRIEKVIAGEK